MMKNAGFSWRRFFATVAALLPLGINSVQAANPAPCFRGINLSGAEFGEAGGEVFKAYAYPTEETIKYFAAKGMNTVRLPFLWERLQPVLGQSFDGDELQRLHDTVELLRKHHLAVVLDPHNYASYQKTQIGKAPVTRVSFADFWARLAVEFSNQDDIIFGLMNEPNNMRADDWLESANLAIRSIRAAGAKNLILVPGVSWTGAHSWQREDEGGANGTVMLGVRDPRNNYAYEVHQYFDDDFSGTHDTCTRNADAVKALAQMSDWARKNKTRVFLGEFGVSQDKTCLAGLKSALDMMRKNGDVWLGWTYWVAGDWWPETEALNAQPHDGHDRKQMPALQAAAKVAGPPRAACRTIPE